ncbi:MAG: bifunctional oligoribonuclease/PAP phosphatase NrnA [Victivallales bacterium]|jgi:phosphoesterase RecJ-like protein|nr:bifunctional oligoribonuclease/PAP phosphatase NrnA [Victivallales bacterium]
MNEALSITEAAALLLGKKRILILTHERPDGDAFGSALGMKEFLHGCCGIHSEVFLPSAPAARYLELIGEYKTTLTQSELSNYDLILLLDCATRDRIACGQDIDSATLPELKCPPMLNVDHHVGNDVNARWNLVVPRAAAASQIATEIALTTQCQINARAATLWLLGIMTDTGAFRFANTLSNTLRITAELLDRGAELERVVNATYYSKPLNQQQFEVELLQKHQKLAVDNQFIYAYIPNELFTKYKFDMRDGEGVIELLREVADTKIVALFYRKGDVFKVSLRSKDSAYPVGDLARSLGGGGHDMASGITLSNMDSKEVETLLLQKVTELLHPNINED